MKNFKYVVFFSHGSLSQLQAVAMAAAVNDGPRWVGCVHGNLNNVILRKRNPFLNFLILIFFVRLTSKLILKMQNYFIVITKTKNKETK